MTKRYIVEEEAEEAPLSFQGVIGEVEVFYRRKLAEWADDVHRHREIQGQTYAALEKAKKRAQEFEKKADEWEEWANRWFFWLLMAALGCLVLGANLYKATH